jgi:hypothetical protein
MNGRWPEQVGVLATVLCARLRFMWGGLCGGQPPSAVRGAKLRWLLACCLGCCIRGCTETGTGFLETKLPCPGDRKPSRAALGRTAGGGCPHIFGLPGLNFFARLHPGVRSMAEQAVGQELSGKVPEGKPRYWCAPRWNFLCYNFHEPGF